MYIDTTNYKIGIKYTLGVNTAVNSNTNGKSYAAEIFHLNKNNDQLEITYENSSIIFWPNNPKVQLQGDIKEVAMALAILLQQNYDNRHQNIILNNIFYVTDAGEVSPRLKFFIENKINRMLFDKVCEEISNIWKTVKLMK